MMKRLILGLAVLALAVGPTFAADIAKEEGVYVEGIPGSYEDQFGDRGNALVASIIVGTFTDLGPAYQTALNNAGMSADLIYDPYGVWPPLDDYCLILVSTSDMWWTYDYWTADEAILAAFIDDGGAVVVVGQDYLWSHPGGMPSPFCYDYLGVASANQDLNATDTVLDWEGTEGGPLAGMSGTINSCYGENDFYTDEIVPVLTGMCWWSSALVPWPVDGGASTPVTCCSSVEFACDLGGLDAVVAAFVTWLGTPTPTETTTWGGIKGMFR